MSFIIGKSCVECVDTSCVTVCPVDCINGPLYIDQLGEEVRKMTPAELKGKQLYIDPSMCINCGVPFCQAEYTYFCFC